VLLPIQFSHLLLEEIIKPGDVVVDATMGNGNDTLRFAKLGARVYAFDVQQQAIDATRQLLSEHGFDAELILDGHEHVLNYVDQPVKAAIFNLGYLPKTDKSVITHGNTTIQAIEGIMSLLVTGGRIAIMVYWGHEGGAAEKEAVNKFVAGLPQAKWHAYQYVGLNQANNPPQLIVLEKR
jgi:16S rRNA C1402 N4-methylase RsmH